MTKITVQRWCEEEANRYYYVAARTKDIFDALLNPNTSKEKIEFINKYPLFMRPKDVCEFLGINHRKLNQMRICGEMPYYILPTGARRYLNLDIWELKNKQT